MKKHLFFAFAAAAVLASCSSHDDFDNYSAGTPQAPVDDNSPQEILLGVGAQANVATRGTGTVGGNHNDIGDDGRGGTYNKWQKQRINVYMFKKYEVDERGTATTAFELATETVGGSDYIYKNALFMAPNGETSGAARHIDGQTETEMEGSGPVTYKRSYYPMNGNFDFWAYRLDDANYKYNAISYKTFASGTVEGGYVAYKKDGENVYSTTDVDASAADINWVKESAKEPEITYHQVYVQATDKVVNNEAPTVTTGDIATAKITVPFIIDGTQDVMAASTELTKADAGKLNGGNGTETEEVNTYYGQETFKKYAKSLYSAKTARKGVQPNLKFKHLLTRFTFDAKQMADATNDGVGNDNEAVRIKKIEVKSKINGEIVATYSNVNEGIGDTDPRYVPTGLNYVIGNKMNKTNDAEEYLQLKKRPTSGDQNEKLVALTDGTQTFEYIVLAANQIENSAATTAAGGTKVYYAVGDKVAEADVASLDPDNTRNLYKKIELNGIALNTTDYTPIGEALLVMPGEAKYLMDITVEQTVYGREEEDGDGVVTSKEVKTQTIKDLEIRAAEVKDDSHPNNGELEETSPGLTTFAAGNSYNVRVQVYGLTKIEVKTTLEPWAEGGHIDLDPDNQM